VCRIRSNVSSPGFVSRIVQEANKESKSKSGYLNRIGNRMGSPSFSFPKGALYTSSYGGGRRKLRRQESSHTVFVKVAPPTHHPSSTSGGNSPPVTPMCKTPPGIVRVTPPSQSQYGPVATASSSASASSGQGQGLGGSPGGGQRSPNRGWSSATKRERSHLGPYHSSPVSESVIEALASKRKR